MFFCEYCEIFKNTYFEKHLRTTASENTPTVMLSYEICEIFKNTYFEEHLQKTASICFTSKYYSVAEFGLDETSTDCILFNQMQLYNLHEVKISLFNISINILIKFLTLHAFWFLIYTLWARSLRCRL